MNNPYSINTTILSNKIHKCLLIKLLIIYFMTVEKIDLEYLTWRKLYEAVIELACRIKKENYKPDMIVAVLKGGLIPARLLMDLLSINEIGFIGVKFYKGIVKHDVKPELTLPPIPSVNNKKILVVDDVVETGRTIQLVIDELFRYGAREVKTLTLYVKKWSPILPDYYYKVSDKWIVFPWEIVETVKNNVDLGSIVEEDVNLYKLIKNQLLT